MSVPTYYFVLVCLQPLFCVSLSVPTHNLFYYKAFLNLECGTPSPACMIFFSIRYVTKIELYMDSDTIQLLKFLMHYFILFKDFQIECYAIFYFSFQISNIDYNGEKLQQRGIIYTPKNG